LLFRRSFISAIWLRADHAADQLHVKVAQCPAPLPGFAHHRKASGSNSSSSWALPGRDSLRSICLKLAVLCHAAGRRCDGADLLLQQVDVRDQG